MRSANALINLTASHKEVNNVDASSQTLRKFFFLFSVLCLIMVQPSKRHSMTELLLIGCNALTKTNISYIIEYSVSELP